MDDDDALISLAAALALEAGAAILAVRRRGFDVVRKEDRSPVTEADVQCELAIRKILEGEFLLTS